ncbi:hypothetical protein ACIPWL_29215 [Streptomyces sp. NPDC090023]|uniref:hypothetical protein n=1 Tax=unclassified Streptomyces TaxID=2593676 RepID=UPI0037F3848E
MGHADTLLAMGGAFLAAAFLARLGARFGVLLAAGIVLPDGLLIATGLVLSGIAAQPLDPARGRHRSVGR